MRVRVGIVGGGFMAQAHSHAARVSFIRSLLWPLQIASFDAAFSNQD